jgi:transposase
MPEDAPRPAQAAIHTDLGAIFVSLELSRRAWLITSLSPGGGEKMSKHSVPASDVSGLLRRFAELRRKATASCPSSLIGRAARRAAPRSR